MTHRPDPSKSRTLTPLVLALAVLAVLAGLLSGGCSAKKKRSGMEQYNSLIRAQQESMAVQQAKQPVVFVHGSVQRPIVAWRENLTLAETLLEAGYTSPLSPRAIRVTRQGRVYTVDVRRLLRGTDNPVLEPGDVVDVVR